MLGFGALAERVVDGVDGFVVDKNNPADLIKLLRRLAVDPSSIGQMRVPAGVMQANNLEHLAAVAASYDHLLAAKVRYSSAFAGKKRRTELFAAHLTRRFSDVVWNELGVRYDQNKFASNLRTWSRSPARTSRHSLKASCTTSLEPAASQNTV